MDEGNKPTEFWFAAERYKPSLPGTLTTLTKLDDKFNKRKGL
jgi:hypothetical protein